MIPDEVNAVFTEAADKAVEALHKAVSEARLTTTGDVVRWLDSIFTDYWIPAIRGQVYAMAAQEYEKLADEHVGKIFTKLAEGFAAQLPIPKELQ